MIYLKTILSAPNEIKYLKLNLREAFTHIDKFIICEFNRTHVGTERELVLEKYLDVFTGDERKKIIYLGADISREANFAKNDSNLAHKNEQLMRGYFASQIDLNGEDIVFSVDADEIIFGRFYDKIIGQLGFFNRALVLPLYQFYYRVNYLWENNEFIAPTVCKAKYYKNKYPAQWRYDGKLFPERTGCHFSWCLTIDEMLAKLETYAHHQDYGHLAKREILEAAVKNKTYPFDPNVDFRIKVLDIRKDKEYYPEEIYNMLDDFREVLG
ncbi:MAG: hypothetical protein M1609_01710 [Firmicutes bacterium]|nr:hypothetical protein [Bacillota bacterium]